MDCSICMDEINKQTGIVTLSCEHSFHFRCIDSWFTKQIWDDLDQTCPCCRNGGGEMDRCEVQAVEEDEEDDDESYEDEGDEEEEVDYPLVERILDAVPQEDFLIERNNITGQVLVTPLHQVALERFRNLFSYLNEWEPETPQQVAARKIQAVYRGYKARDDFEQQQAARTLLRLFLQAYT